MAQTTQDNTSIPSPQIQPNHSIGALRVMAERLLAEQADNEELLATISHAPAQSSPNNEWPEDAMGTDDEADRLDDSVLQVLELLGPALSDEDDSSDSKSETEQRQLLYQALEMLNDEDLDDEDDPEYEALLDAELAKVHKEEEANGWFPFKKKEGVVRALKKRLKERFGQSIVQCMSPLGTLLFGLKIEDIIRQDLANPFISPHIVTIPEHTAGTSIPITRLSQSSKWLKEFDREI
ncbi:uncharacterized protein MELLADRAFT_87856 [Melampsora larici-populina 98AG31]|uniref:Uncharacterized protein n=1 Tax=Melampsora larici-populina (strain 98AG31 / pathotype 3-4-7) TaxID=747676 RepID=F4RPR2_MELLP|nr:uncharacterized protein MELLADRAFT_87856 [Melampsora larici-populina 98AG31]EGG05588.1 hypothetical protein MELLADRAFT_87856 [Melampsora larici-populina 98AG31]